MIDSELDLLSIELYRKRDIYSTGIENSKLTDYPVVPSLGYQAQPVARFYSHGNKTGCKFIHLLSGLTIGCSFILVLGFLPQINVAFIFFNTLFEELNY